MTTAEQLFAASVYLFAHEADNAGRKTRVVTVQSRSSFAVLGVIRWYGAWRQYVFHPEPGTLFNTGCLSEIVGALALLTNEQRRDAKARRT